MRFLASLIVGIVILLLAAIGYGLWQIIQRFNRALGDLSDSLFIAIAIAATAAVVLLILGGAWYALRWLSHRVRLIYPDRNTALFPALVGVHDITNINDPGVHALAALTRGSRRRPTAAMVDRALHSRYDMQQIEPPSPQPQPDVFPPNVTIYGAPVPDRPALPIGVDARGRHMALPLRNLGNVLIGGLPGQGKSELLAAMIAGLMRQDPSGETIQLAIADMKLVSFGALPSLDILYRPPVVQIEDAHDLMHALRSEVARRYQLLLDARVRSVEEYRQVTGEPMPYIVAAIDEIIDLTADPNRNRSQEFLASAQEIGRKGRAAGVSLVMATQRPSADVIPSSLRNLAGAAVAFHVQRNHDSIAILGEPGAELLPKIPGRCLVRSAGVVPVQSYYAGLEGGQFDRFLLAAPQGMTVRNTGDTGDTGGMEAWYVPDSGDALPVPVFRTDDRQAQYTDTQVAYIRHMHARLGSLKAVQRALYDGQEGGYWFYRIREVITGESMP